MAVSIRSYNQILGDMIRKIIAETPVNDVNTGSVLLSLLEAAATNDFENNVAILSVLELLNIDALKNNDLDARAADFGLTRRAAIKASGFVQIGDSNITKQSTTLFPVKPAPIAGQTTLFVNNASGFAPTGTLFIGRGTPNFEGPISYLSIVDNVTFFTITLASALEKDHLISETVIDAQGTTDRLVAAGTVVKIPANNQNAAIEYVSLRDAVLPAGEDTVDNVEVIAVQAGAKGNAGIDTIVEFVSPTFPGATITNTVPFSNGRDIESDFELRERVKSFSSTLARGTKAAILAGIVGVSDSEDNKQVASAVITEPVTTGDPAIVFIDDGSGFQPSFRGQSVDTLINDANGDEEFVQLANFPLPRPQVINTADGPFQLTDGMQFTVKVDDDEEVVTFTTSQFGNISAATLPEIIVAVNDQAELFKMRLTDNSTRLLVSPTVFDSEVIQIPGLRIGEDATFNANQVFKFPTNEFSFIKLYKNNLLLKEKEKAAALITAPFSNWNVTTASNIIISVDGTPAQDRLFETSDFGGQSFTSLTLDDWVEAFNNKFAGLSAEATSSQTLRITSNQTGAESSIEVFGGSLLNKWFPDLDTSATGQTSDFDINRQTGNLRILADVDVGDKFSAGTEDTKGAALSTTTVTGSYNVSTDVNGRPAEMVVIVDSLASESRAISLALGSTITISDEGSGIMRILASSASVFRTVQPLDFIYITNRGDIDGTGVGLWADIKSSGLFKIISKGAALTDGVDTFIEVENADIVTGSYAVQASEDVQAFTADTYPQIWRGSFVDNPPSEPIQGIVDSLNEKLVNVVASVFKTNSIKLTSSTEEGGSIAIPVSVGNAKLLFTPPIERQEGNPSHVANRRPDKDFISIFERTDPVNINVWLDRFTYTDKKGALTANAEPGTEGTDSYSEVLESTGILNEATVTFDDIISITRGNNRGHYRYIKQILSNDKIGTQFDTPATVMDHIIGNEFQILKSLEFSDEDNIVTIIDGDPITQTIDVPIARTGRVNAGSQASTFLPTNLAFSADDADNEPGIDFGSPQVWSKTLNNSEFQDYKLWFRARNFYVTGGVGSGGGSFLVRSNKFGPTGEQFRFALDYPSFPDQTNSIVHINTPQFSSLSYFFASNSARTTNILNGNTVSVTDLGSDNFRYTWPAGTDFSTVLVGDIFSALNDSGFGADNRGQFRINAVSAASRTFDVYNPDGAPTTAAAAEINDVTAVGDIIGSPSVHTITTVADIAGSLDGLFFIIFDTAGSVAVYFDVDNTGTPEPAHGASRSIRIDTILSGDNATTVATKIKDVVDLDPEFSASSALAVITITNIGNGATASATAGTSGFTASTVSGVDPASLDGKFFIISDAAGTVAFWFDVDNDGTLEPIHGADRSITITTVVSGDSATTVAGRIAAAATTDVAFSGSSVGPIATITDAANGNRPAPSTGTSGFTIVTTTNGSNGVLETVTQATSVFIFPISSNQVSDIVTKVNEIETRIVKCVAVGDDTKTIDFATREEVYTPAGPGDFSASLAFGHDPDATSSLNDHVKLFDGETHVLRFENTNPNFILKTALNLQDVAPTIYRMDTAPVEDTVETGEPFKLIPLTLDNLQHHLTQKALSQMSIVSDVRTSTDNRQVQINSGKLGSDGAVEVVGGRANKAEFRLDGDSEISPVGIEDFLEINIQAFPDTLNIGDHVKLENDSGVPRFSRLQSTDTFDVVKISDDQFEYRYNPKNVFFNQFVSIDITDVSALHGRPAGTVWRWTHTDSGSLFTVTDKTAGVAAAPDDEIAAGGTDAARLDTLVLVAAGVGIAQQFVLVVSGGTPTQADFFTFESADGATFAVWFDVDAAGTAPTAASFVAATNKIEVDILSTDTDNQIVSKLATTLTGNGAFTTSFSSFQSSGADLTNVVEGDMISAFGTMAGWDSTNQAQGSGEEIFGGFPIIEVNAASKYVDVPNPFGVAMASTPISATGNVIITSTPRIQWSIDHATRSTIVQVVVSSGVATATLSQSHRMNVGDTFDVLNSSVVPDVPGAGIGTVISVISANQFTFSTSTGDGSFSGGTILKAGRVVTRYIVERLGFNDLMRLSHVNGDTPSFSDFGVAVDDMVLIKGNTFSSNNNGTFRVLAVDNDAIIFQNPTGKDELNTLLGLNNQGLKATWTSNSDVVSGVAGTFENVVLGDRVKKVEDPDVNFRQVTALLDAGDAPTTAALAVKMILGALYPGTSSDSEGIIFDQANDVEDGIFLNGESDVEFFEGDATFSGDSLFIQDIIDPSWFSPNNVGTFEIKAIGTDATDFTPFLRVDNSAGVAETAKTLAQDDKGFIITESDDVKFSTIRQVVHTAIDENDEAKRVVFLTPANRTEKFSESNKTLLSALGKIGYSTDVTSGIDGYTFYTGLLRTVQRVIDGFEPDPENFPGRRAIGGIIEILPPLVRRVAISVDITTNEGVNISEISNEIKSTVINYIDSLGVGEDVILSEIIARIMIIKGIAAVTFVIPEPATERISVADDEKAFIVSSDISIA